jgi:hypothetical protein
MPGSGSQVCNSKRIPSSGILYHKLWKGFTDVSGKICCLHLHGTKLFYLTIEADGSSDTLGNFNYILPRHSVKDSRFQCTHKQG